jgi:hypothetical protein
MSPLGLLNLVQSSGAMGRLYVSGGEFDLTRVSDLPLC